MWPFGKKDDEEEDRSLVEISNDEGDHWVADIPTKGVKETEKSLRAAGVERGDDEKLMRMYNAAEKVDQRDSSQYRFHSDRVIDEKEDLEDTFDREEDDSDSEHSEQSAWRFW
ncbi:MAG: hypothetical protein F6J97_00900 [Leptolyngbya sp. SIO4C1]|nr:hypothetical protein [Leptolyngbya sp. SIO4C1]